MMLAKNPTDARIREISERSAEKAAKWIEDPATGDRYFWEAEQAFHAAVAEALEIAPPYRKGLAVIEAAPAPQDRDGSASGPA